MLFILVVLAAACTHKPDVTGKWIDQKDKVNGIKLDKDGYAWFVNGDKEAGGTGLMREDGKEVQMKYTVDDSKSPMWFDLYVTEKSTGKEESHLLGLINLIDKDNMEMMLGIVIRDSIIDSKSKNYARMKRAQ